MKNKKIYIIIVILIVLACIFLKIKNNTNLQNGNSIDKLDIYNNKTDFTKTINSNEVSIETDEESNKNIAYDIATTLSKVYGLNYTNGDKNDSCYINLYTIDDNILNLEVEFYDILTKHMTTKTKEELKDKTLHLLEELKSLSNKYSITFNSIIVKGSHDFWLDENGYNKLSPTFAMTIGEDFNNIEWKNRKSILFSEIEKEKILFEFEK